ncbi:MAG: transposase [Planctomycetes bacterium]|nr:transposase [Planctomycetota bacterium]
MGMMATYYQSPKGATDMAHSLTRVLVHGVFSTKDRSPVIAEEWQGRLHQYVGGIVENLDSVALAIGGIDNHIHVAFVLPSTRSLADFIGKLKANASKWVNNQKMLPNRFAWQTGYGAFSVSESKLDTVLAYIANQKQHHEKMTYEEEIRKLALLHKIPFDEKYLLG